MARVAIAFPILPGKADEAKGFAQQLMGPRHDEFVEAEQRFDFTRQYWFLQAAPAGTLLIAYLEADNPLHALQQFAAAQTPFDLWYKQQVQTLTGLDMSQPPQSLPEQIFEWAGP